MTVLSDVRFALAVFRRRPGVPLMTAGLFALSVGLAGGLWAVVDAVALRPLPYPDAHELVAVMERHPERGLMSVTPANFWDWSSRLPAFSAVVGLGSLEASLAGRGTPLRVTGTKVTERFFDVLGVLPAIGRPFADGDFRSDGRAVIISDGLWDRQFARAAAVIGEPVLLDGTAYTLVGVMPRGLKTIGNSDVWVPWVMSAPERAERRFHLVGVMARLASGHKAESAERDLQGIYLQLQADHPDTNSQWTVRVVSLRELMLGDSRQALFSLGAAVLALLLVACVNMGGLLMAWLRQRRPELALRLALGASTGRVVRQLLVETLTWAAAGLAAGLLLASAFVRLFGAVGTSPSLEYDFEPAIDLRVVLGMGVLLVAIAVTTALLPAWIGSLRAADLVPRRASATGRWGARCAMGLQVALSLVLVSTAASLLDGFREVADLAGPRRVSVGGVDVSLAEGRYRDETSQARFFERLLDGLSRRSEIRAAAALSYVPPARIYGNVRFTIEGRATASDALTALASATSPGAFDLLGIGIRRGRAIDARDGADAPRVAVISASLARRYWSGEDPIGHRITVVGDVAPLTVVGVVDDVRQPLSADPRAESVLYLSYRQVPWPFMTVLVEPSGELGPAMAAVREEVARLDPAQAVGAPRPLDDIRREWLTQPRLRSQIVALFGVSALLLTLVGLHARVAYGVASRERELAIRQAVGARPADVVLTMSRETVAVVLGGAVAGVALLPAANAAVAAVVAGLPLPRPGVIAAVIVGVVLLAVGSAYVPARRAGRINPAESLRAE